MKLLIPIVSRGSGFSPYKVRQTARTIVSHLACSLCLVYLLCFVYSAEIQMGDYL